MVIDVRLAARCWILATVASTFVFENAVASPQSASGAEQVVVSSGGEYVSYPARAWRQSGGTRVYDIDMSPALSRRLPKGETLELEMSWTADNDGQIVCFRHRDVSNCRSLPMELSLHIQPRFMPTMIADPPGLYVRFENVVGETVLIQYIEGVIRTPDEWFAELRK